MPLHDDHGMTTDLQDDLAYQDAILQDVSRTFALTIPLLPNDLCRVVGNAYLLCRIADTLEDSPDLAVDAKVRLSELFVETVGGRVSPDTFVNATIPLLGEGTTVAEKDLIGNTVRVIRVTHSFQPEVRHALERCVRIMTEGMETFQEGQFTAGVRDMAQLDAYCYHVAGVVGEMLTELFCLYSKGCAQHRAELEQHAVSFGEALQLVNILKDVWDDKARNVCWLPRSIFDEHGFDLATLSPSQHGASFEAGMGEMIAITCGHLRRAFAYTLALPRHDTGMRSFCLLALGLAVLSLRKLYAHRDFTAGRQVKVSRRCVYATWIGIRVFRRSNLALRVVFGLLMRGLPS